MRSILICSPKTKHMETASNSGIHMDLYVLLKLNMDLYLKILLCVIMNFLTRYISEIND